MNVLLYQMFIHFQMINVSPDPETSSDSQYILRHSCYFPIWYIFLHIRLLLIRSRQLNRMANLYNCSFFQFQNKIVELEEMLTQIMEQNNQDKLFLVKKHKREEEENK